MMKFVMMMLFISLMLVKNRMLMFYYNLCYLMSFMTIFMYMYVTTKWSMISLMFGCHYYSIWLFILSFWILSLMMMCLNSLKVVKMLMFLMLLFSLMMFFLSMDLILFYLMFEISLIPTFFLIIYWGVNLERISASYYLLMYMLLVSFPLLIYIFKMYLYGLTLKFSLMLMVMETYDFNFWGYIIIYMAFFIKMPLYIVHIWLPKAHVEAPVYGSMILAGVLLKMGGYGLIRMLELFIKSSLKYNYLIFSVSIVGSMLMGMVCLVQIDMKSLVAYSSVVHMNLILCSMLTLFNFGFLSSYIMMIAHGLCSSGLFYMVNLYYSRSMSRLLILNKGLISKLPTFMLWWFLLCSVNFSFPFSLNFISEILMLMVILNWSSFTLVYLMMICFFSSAYSLYLFSYVYHGGGEEVVMDSYNSGVVKEFLILIMHFFPLLIFLLNLIIFM
uniref:NADH dehydrogenase subunit 4 n=1 Tax=Pheidole megacephala TaxID=300850 RepID=UPI002580591C|nr:NADH dehydrogenase subunit 4 [Pheidole megacephala]WGV34085.1 NADH dehydrogenase subunit 4 [Pheidole megacephala]